MAGGEHGAVHFDIAGWFSARFSHRQNGADRPGGWRFTLDTEVELAAHQVVRPDIAGWRRERMPTKPSGFPLRLRPDWVCEVMTDGDARRRDGVQKRRIYADSLVPHYWLVDTQRQAFTVLGLSPRGYVEILEAGYADVVRAEPFDSVELQVRLLFGDDTD
jgi:Uma2 family endonuclease